MKYQKKSFKVYAGKPSAETACFSKAETCKNNGIKCGDCVRVQGKFTEYQTTDQQVKEWQESNLKLAEERNGR